MHPRPLQLSLPLVLLLAPRLRIARSTGWRVGQQGEGVHCSDKHSFDADKGSTAAPKQLQAGRKIHDSGKAV
jgi:hypothetical protein